MMPFGKMPDGILPLKGLGNNKILVACDDRKYPSRRDWMWLL